MAKRKTLKCPDCSRRFSMAAHLARHRSTTHARGGKRRRTPATKRGPGRPRSSGRAMTYVGESTTPLNGEGERLLGEMQHYYQSLVDRRASLDAEIDAMERAVSAMGNAATTTRSSAGRRGRPAGGGRRRAEGRAGSLKDFIGRVLGSRSTALSPREIGTQVKRAGFKTKAADLTKAVSNTLPKMRNVKRVGFGQYTLKS